jgi:predicted Zn-dependent protease
VDDYVLLRELGRGCNGVVYLASREGLERLFALKILLELDPEGVARFQVEAQAAGRIDDPGVVGVVDLGLTGGRPYTVMEYCPGQDLEERLRAGPLPPQEAAALVRDLARTLTKVHAAGVIHRDLKPANVILEASSGRPRITDFGLARDRSAGRLTRTGQAIGTPYYMAPEQAAGGTDVDERVDIYALGVLLYRCLTGALPYPGSTIVEVYQRIQAGRFPPPRQLAPEVSPELEAICLRAMAHDRHLRTPSATVLQEELDAYLAEPPAPSTTRLLPANRSAKVTVLVLATAAALGLGFAMALRARAQSQRAAAVEARLAQAKALVQGGSLEDARTQLARAQALAEGQDALERDVDAHLAALEVEFTARRLRRLVSEGAEPSEVLAAVEAAQPEAVVRALSAASDVARAAEDALRTPGFPDDLNERLPAAAALARGEDALARRLELLQALRAVRAAVEEERLVDARASLVSARRLERLVGDLSEVLEKEQRRLEGREALSGARALAREGGPLKAVLARLDSASRASAEDGFLAEVSLERVRLLRRRGRHREVLDAAAELTRRRDGLGARASYEVGIALLRNGDRPSASTLLEGLSADDPAGLVGSLAAAARHALLGRPSDAEGPARRALERAPDDPEAQLLLAVALTQDPDRLGEAQRLLEAAKAAEPDHAEVYLARARLQAVRGDPQGARHACGEALRLTEPAPLLEALTLRAQLAFLAGDLTSALRDADRALAQRPDAAALVWRGLARLESGEEQAARADLARAVDLDAEAVRRIQRGASASPRVSGPLALALSPAGAPSSRARPAVGRALEAARLALAKRSVGPAPEGEGVLARLSRLQREGRYEEVVAQSEGLAERAELPADQRARALVVRAAAMIVGNFGFDRAAVASQQAHALDPDGAVGLAAAATAALVQGDAPGGEALARRALALDPEHVDAWVNVSWALYARGRAEEGLRAAVRACELGPLRPRALFALFFVAASAGDVAGGREAVSLLISLSPTPPLHLLRMRADLALSPGSNDADRLRAIEDFDQILAAQPRDAVSFLRRGLLHHSRGDEARAAQDWRAGQAADPRAFAHAVRSLGNPQLQALVRSALRGTGRR